MERRQMVWKISAELLAERFGIDHARIVGVRFDPFPAMFELLLESEQYAPVPEGAIPPYTELETPA